MEKKTNYLVQPIMRRLFYSDTIRLTAAAEKVVLQLHLAMGGDLNEGGVCSGVIAVPRGDIRDWRSYDDAIMFDRVKSRDEYQNAWIGHFPDEVKPYTFETYNSQEGLSIRITDGQSSVLLSPTVGEYMIPSIHEILKFTLAELVA